MHVADSLGKLGSRSRTDAMRRAGELQLLETSSNRALARAGAWPACAPPGTACCLCPPTPEPRQQRQAPCTGWQRSTAAHDHRSSLTLHSRASAASAWSFRARTPGEHRYRCQPKVLWRPHSSSARCAPSLSNYLMDIVVPLSVPIIDNVTFWANVDDYSDARSNNSRRLTRHRFCASAAGPPRAAAPETR